MIFTFYNVFTMFNHTKCALGFLSVFVTLTFMYETPLIKIVGIKEVKQKSKGNRFNGAKVHLYL